MSAEQDYAALYADVARIRDGLGGSPRAALDDVLRRHPAPGCGDDTCTEAHP